MQTRGSPLARIFVHSIKNQAKINMGLMGESTQNRRKNQNLRTPSRRVANPSYANEPLNRKVQDLNWSTQYSSLTWDCHRKGWTEIEHFDIWRVPRWHLKVKRNQLPSRMRSFVSGSALLPNGSCVLERRPQRPIIVTRSPIWPLGSPESLWPRLMMRITGSHPFSRRWSHRRRLSLCNGCAVQKGDGPGIRQWTTSA